MRRRTLMIWPILGIAVTASAATPPPVPPQAQRIGPAVICAPGYALRLGVGDSAWQYGEGWWVFRSAAGHELGVRSDRPLRELGVGRTVSLPGIGQADRRRVREYPGNRRWGWTYVIDRAGTPVTVSSAAFRGKQGDVDLLRPVLLGAARAAACPS